MQPELRGKALDDPLPRLPSGCFKLEAGSWGGGREVSGLEPENASAKLCDIRVHVRAETNAALKALTIIPAHSRRRHTGTPAESKARHPVPRHRAMGRTGSGRQRAAAEAGAGQPEGGVDEKMMIDLLVVSWVVCDSFCNIVV